MKYRSEIHLKPQLPSFSTPHNQAGVSIIAGIFLITGLAVLGALITRLTTVGNTEVINEWYSAQALYSAESGVDWAAYDLIHGGTGVATNSAVSTDRTWFTATTTATHIGGKTLYIINSVGTAGTDALNPMVQRKIEVQFIP
ncbi:MAG: hypothetical protein C0631_08570 [Sedimenticola sp.]|jgi:hypothetical protein|nr:MAG: hypothetical protein C0631_08570 [Sedimenticola sp.]